MPQNSPSGEADRHAQLPPLLRRAVIAHEAGRLDEAYPLYRQFVDQNPRHPTALQLLGLLHSQRGEYETAIVMMRESLLLFPGQAEVANNLGNALFKAGKLDDAIESYSEALDVYPRYPDALRNLGLCYLEQLRLDDAEKSFRRCLEVKPDDTAALIGLGNAFKLRGAIEDAIPCFEKAIELQHDYADAHHNLGVCLRLQHRPRDALRHYSVSRRLGLDRAELYHNMGNALIDTLDVDGAIDAYQAAVDRNPRDLESHRNLNSLLWQQDRTDEYLKSYQRALGDHPAAIELRQAYAIALNQQESFDIAEHVLRHGLRNSPDSSNLTSLLAYALEGQGRWQESLDIHLSVVEMAGSAPDHRIGCARALLACGRPDEALQHAEVGAIQLPFNQRALAYLGLCWRMLGDERDEILNDYDNMVQVFDLPVPAEYVTTEEFNERLTAVLNRLHFGKRHPAEQTLRGGSQTSGDLFDREDPEIRDLAASLNECICEYIERMPEDKEHPLYVRRSNEFEFAASWSVRLARSGYHTMHVHPLGWISSAYYVQVPPEIIGSDARGGGLKFGEPDIDIGEAGAPRRHVQPMVGRLALFPSYMWHGTVPFESDAARMTVAFDVTPKSQ